MRKWREPLGFVALDPPPPVRGLLHLGLLALLGVADGPQLSRLGTNRAEVEAAIDTAPFWDAAGRARAHTVWRSTQVGDFAWVPVVADAARGSDPAWSRVLQIVWCGWHPELGAEALTAGAVGARVNTLLDAVGAGATGVEVGGALAELSQAVMAGSPTAFQDWTLNITAHPVAGFVADAVTFGLGGHAMSRFSSWYDRRVNPTDDWVTELTLRYALAHEIRAHDRERFAAVAEALYADALALGRDAEQRRRVRMLLAAHAAMAGQDPGLAVRMPDVAGLPVNEAVDLIRAMGLKADLVDRSGQKRRMLDRSKWIVPDQQPAPGTPLTGPQIRLPYARPDDPATTDLR